MTPKPVSATACGISIIPAPVKLTPGQGAFELSPQTIIYASTGARPEADYLKSELTPATGFNLGITEAPEPAPTAKGIVLKLDPKAPVGHAEGYQLEVTPELITVTARKPAGLFYGCQTILQLLPPEIFCKQKASGIDWTLPSVSVLDYPRFGWRGHLFDVCRHFFTVAEVKRSIDLLALHKANQFHWHLTEDQGWRIEIKRYPRLTEVGAWRVDPDGTRSGGIYTQDEVRDVVEYATKRHINVIPEIEFPGHSRAALACYPSLGCTGGPYEVQGIWGVHSDVYCAGKEETFEFIENVLDEVLALFPSRYIHIGGDECPKDRWKECPHCQQRIKDEGLKDEHELQSYFIRRFDKYLTERGRRLVGWDEILEGGLAPGAVVQSWRGIEGGIQAANAGHDVIMSPTSHCYLDYSYESLPLKTSYSYEPIPEGLDEDKIGHVLGIEGNSWTEFIPDQNRYDHQTYPRMTALAEAGWSLNSVRSWEDYTERMKTHEKRLEILGVKFGKPEDLRLEEATIAGKWIAAEMQLQGIAMLFDVTPYVSGEGVYDAIVWWTSGNTGLQMKSIALLQDGKEVACDVHECFSGYDKRGVVYSLALESYQPGAQYELKCFGAPINGLESNGTIYFRKCSRK